MRATEPWTGKALPQPGASLRLFCALGGVLLFFRLSHAVQSSELALVRTPSNVPVNRTLPDFTPAGSPHSIPDDPSDAQIALLPFFAERIVPVERQTSASVMDNLKGLFSNRTATPAVQNNRAVAGTLRQLQASKSPYETTELAAFVAAHPDSRWSPAFRNEIARRQFQQGWFSQAIAGWDKLWDELKDRRDEAAVEVANEALAHLFDGYIGLGKADRLATLIGEQEARPGHPVIQAKTMRARQSVWLLKHKPSQSVMCGPVALYCILQNRQQPFTPIRLNDVTDDFIATGLSLAQLQKYAQSYGMGLVAARRSSTSAIPTPAIMHLSSGHFSAILEQSDGYYLLEDRPMQFKGWVKLDALEAQSSGFFLVPANSLSSGWQAVSEQEASGIFGRDGAHGQQPLNRSVNKCSPSVGGDGQCQGMAYYTFHQQVASLRVEDSPVGYTPPVGPSVFTRIAYNDLDDSKPVGVPDFSNVGRIWSMNWVAYADITWRPFIINNQTFYRPDYPVVIHVSGGGTEIYYSAAPNDRSFARVLISTNGVLCTRILADGSQELYNTGGLLTPFFLTQSLDPYGNALSFAYDANFRLMAITDAIGQVTTFEYSWTNDIRKVTKITDPFGRFATFSYTPGLDELSSVTDVLGLTSTFSYDTNEFLTTMATPYGTTTFRNSRPAVPNSSYDYWLSATDPEGNTEKVHYIEPIDVPPFGPPIPTVVNVAGTNVPFIAEDARLQFRNSYYWDKKAMKAAPDDISVAKNYRWLTDVSYLITPILEASKEPLESRIWYNYPGHVGGEQYASYPYYPGLGGRPEKILRMLSDGTPQLWQTYYNPQGYLTNVIDPVGRTTTYTYATNLIDLVEVRQKTGLNSSDRISAIAWNAQHLPLSYIDAAGRTTHFAYNSRGQLLAFTNALGETTAFSYDTNGYLVRIDGPLPGISDSSTFTYDGFGRVRTLTPMGGFPLTFDYDAFDRLTVVTFPDGTFEQFGYDRLDRSFARDRLGHRTEYVWNSLRQLMQMKDPLNRITRFAWCECGALNSITDPMGRMTSFQYDIQNRKTVKQLPDGSQIRYVYDSATSRLKSIIDEKGQIKAFEYYPDNNLKKIFYPNAAVPTATVSCQYDANYDRPTALQDESGITTWEYNVAGGVGALEVSKALSSWNNVPVTYQYDALGRGTNRIIGTTGQSYAYDSLGRITQVVNALGNFSYTYDGASRRVVDVSSSTGPKSHYDYFDNSGDLRLRRITHMAPNTSLISRFSYAYDPVGNVTNWVRELASVTNVWDVTYDAADQVSSVQTKQNASSLSYAYGYDAAANRLYEDVNGTRRNFNYNALNQLDSSTDPSAGATYEWDAEARLTAISKGITRSEFKYDGLGRRIGIVEKQNGNIISENTYLWCGAELCEVRDGSGSTINKRVFAQGETIGNGTTSNHYFAKDHLGSIREILDGLGQLETRYDYAPFGVQTVLQENYKPVRGFAGYFAHAPSGLNLTMFRALNPNAGRWLSRDPLQEKAGVNLYAYVKNKPLRVVDELGLDGNCTSFDVAKAVEHLNANADPSYQGRNKCAHYTMDAIDVGCGIDPSKDNNRPRHAYKFGTHLESLGFTQVDTTDYQAGDVIVFDAGEGIYSSGHMQMFNGTKWVSDFMQGKDIYPGPGEWKNLKHTVYRHNSEPAPAPSCNNSSNDSKPDSKPRPDLPWMDFGLMR